MKTLVIYGSQYGSTKRYAEHLSEITGFEAIDYKQEKDIQEFDRIIFMGGSYAGGVLGLKKMHIIELLKDKSLKGIERGQAVVNMIVAGELSVDDMAAMGRAIPFIGEQLVSP